MRLLLSNDDGVHAPGLVLLANRLFELGHAVTVVAPDRERSGVGHAITTEHSLFMREETFLGYAKGVKAFKSNGVPADCVLLGLKAAEPEAELVIAGINSGPNLGCDVFYSGTAAAAREACIENRKAIAVSLCLSSRHEKAHYETALFAVEKLLEISGLFPEKPALLNVNVPNLPLSKLRGFKGTFSGRRRYRDRLQVLSAPGEETSYWVRGLPNEKEEREGSDVWAVNSGFVALTFLQDDTTDYLLSDQVDEKLPNKINLK